MAVGLSLLCVVLDFVCLCNSSKFTYSAQNYLCISYIQKVHNIARVHVMKCCIARKLVLILLYGDKIIDLSGTFSIVLYSLKLLNAQNFTCYAAIRCT